MSTKSRSKPRPSPRPSSKRPPSPAPPGPDPLHTRFSPQQLLDKFHELLPAAELASWLASAPTRFYERAFTPLITLWYCIFQRLLFDHSLGQIVADARAGGADSLSPPGKPLSKRLSSRATASITGARQRVPLSVFEKTLRHFARQIRSWVQDATWRGWHLVLVDGSTFRLRPYKDIPTHFPPHRPGNSKKPPYWCLARVVVCFCATTGAALDCALGSLKSSEQGLVAQLLSRPWAQSLFVADRNFGVYSVVRAVQGAAAQILVRLTAARAAKLARAAGARLADGLDTLLTWNPSPQDQCPEGLDRAGVAGRLLAVRVERPGFRPRDLYLFTTLADRELYPAEALAELYGRRWRVELFFRFVKTELGLDLLECHSAEMARKEWLAGLIAYNLIRAVMVAAAGTHHLPMAALSFSRARQLILNWLWRWLINPREKKSWERLLQDIARCQQPRRKKPRPPEPRAIRPFTINFDKLHGDRAAARQKLNLENAKS